MLEIIQEYILDLKHKIHFSRISTLFEILNSKLMK